MRREGGADDNSGGSGFSGPFFLVIGNRRKERTGQAKLRGVVIREVFTRTDAESDKVSRRHSPAAARFVRPREVRRAIPG